MSDNKKDTKHPYHEGEIMMQSRLGITVLLEKIGNLAISAKMPEQHRKFYEQLPIMFVGGADSQGDLWASILFGEAGFVQTPNPSSIVINTSFQTLEPLANQLQSGSEIGLLGIEFETRRRNRVNANIAYIDESHIVLLVKQCFGNCPKYIQTRDRKTITHTESVKQSNFTHLNDRFNRIIRNTDSFFIASQHIDGVEQNNRGVDVSHRGGMPGFIEIVNDKTLLIPDYSGNNFFNTLGNIMLNPKVGLLFIDYIKSDLMMLTGEAEVVWAEDESLPFDDVDRMIRFTLKKGVHLQNAVPMKWTLDEYSPFSQSYQR